MTEHALSEPSVVLDGAVTPARQSRGSAYFELTKPRITLMVAITAAVGFLVTATRPLDWLLFLHAILGTAIVAAGSAALNQVIEWPHDARMRRTANRPIPSGRIPPRPALGFALAVSLAGVGYLAVAVNLLTAILGALTLLGYVLVYTPMKRRSSLATLVGAVPGAVPPMMGVAAATGELGPAAWALFGILFLWQMPHFLAIAWLYRSDYDRGGFPLLTLGADSGRRTTVQMVLYAAALVPVSLLPNAVGLSGPLYLVGALLLGLIYLAATFSFGLAQDARAARRLLLVSVLYLPAVLSLLVVDQVWV